MGKNKIFLSDFTGKFLFAVVFGFVALSFAGHVALAANATQFELNHPGVVSAGGRAAYVVTRKDVSNNPATSSTNVVYLYTSETSPDTGFYDAPTGGNIITSVTISSGTSTAVFYYYDEVSGTKTVTASDNATAPDGATGLIDATDSIVVSPNVTAQLSLINLGIGTVIAGERAEYMVRREDTYNNQTTSGVNTVYLYTTATSTGAFYDAPSGGSLITSVNITNGNSTSSSFWYTDTLSGAKTVYVSDNSTAPDDSAGIDDGEDSIPVTPAAAVKYIVAGPVSEYARTRAGFAVSRKDVFNNAVTSGVSTVYLYNNSSSTNAKFYNDSLAGSVITSIQISGGQSTASFWYYDDTAGTIAVTGSDNAIAPDGATGILDDTAFITILPAAVKFVIIQPADGTVDAPISVTVQAQLPDNSVDTNYQSDVTLTAASSATGGGLVDIINGIGTKNISDTVAETATLTLSDSQTTGLSVTSTKQVVFATGALAQFTLNHPGTITAGTRAAYTVTRKDQYGNLVASATTTIYLYTNSSSSQAEFYPDGVATGTPITSLTISPGASSADFWYYDDMFGGWTIAVSDNASTSDGATGINDAVDSLAVTAGATTRFLLNHSAPITVGTRAAYEERRVRKFSYCRSGKCLFL